MRGVAALLALLALLAGSAGAEAAPGLIGREVALGDVRATIWLWPGIFRPTSVQVQLDDGAGLVAPDVRRVDVAFAMIGMNHGAQGMTLLEAEPGVYVGSAYLIAMEGPWWMALRVEHGENALAAARVAFDVAPERGGVSNLLHTRQSHGGVQIEDVVVHPQGIIPETLSVRAGQPLRLEIIYVDEPSCGSTVRLESALAEVPVADGLAELAFTPEVDGDLVLRCTPTGLVLGP